MVVLLAGVTMYQFDNDLCPFPWSSHASGPHCCDRAFRVGSTLFYNEPQQPMGVNAHARGEGVGGGYMGCGKGELIEDRNASQPQNPRNVCKRSPTEKEGRC